MLTRGLFLVPGVKAERRIRNMKLRPLDAEALIEKCLRWGRYQSPMSRVLASASLQSDHVVTQEGDSIMRIAVWSPLRQASMRSRQVATSSRSSSSNSNS